MKKIKYIATALFLGLFLSSCDDYLEEDVRSNVTGDEFYTTEEGFESLVNANYAQLKEIYGNEPWLFAAGTDMYAEGRDAETEWEGRRARYGYGRVCEMPMRR